MLLARHPVSDVRSDGLQNPHAIDTTDASRASSVNARMSARA
jgi:hypothetical protein